MADTTGKNKELVFPSKVSSSKNIGAKPKVETRVPLKQSQIPLVGSMLPPPPLVNKAWNNSVLRSNQNTIVEQQYDVMQFEQRVKDEDKEARDDIIKKINLDNSGIVDSSIAMFKVAQDNNDFYNISKAIGKKIFKPNADWIELTKNRDNMLQILGGNDIPQSYSEIASNTKSPEEFMEFTRVYKEDQERNKFIDSHISSTGKITGAILGAVSGLDTVAGVFMPWAAISKGARAVDAIEDVYSAQRAAKKLATTKRTATIAGLSYSVTAPLIKDWAYEDYTFTDGIIDAVAFSAIDTAFITRRALSAKQRDVADTISAYKYKESMDKLKTDVPLLEYKPMQNLLPNNGRKELNIEGYRTDDVIISYPKTLEQIEYSKRLGIPLKPDTLSSGIRANADEISIKILNRVDDIDSRILELSSKRVGKVKKSQYADEVSALMKEKESLQGMITRISNTTKVKHIPNRINDAKREFPDLFTDDVAKEADSIFNDVANAVNDIEAHPDFDDAKSAIDDFLNDNNAKNIAVKTNKDGSIDIGVRGKDGKFKALARKNKGKIAIVAALAGTSLMAGDREGNAISDFAQYAGAAFIIGFLGKQVFDSIANNKGLGNAIRSSSKAFSKSIADKAVNSTPEGEYVGRIYGLHKRSMKAMGYIFQETIMSATDSGKKLISDLVWDTENTAMPSVWFLKNRQHNENMTKFYSSYNKAWDSFAKNKKISAGGKFAYYSSFSKYKREFNDLVTMLAENPSMRIPSGMEDIVATVRSISDDIVTRANVNGVKGFETSKKTGEIKNYQENYIMRVLQADEIYSAIVLADGKFGNGKAFIELRKNLAAMYENAHMTNDSAKVDEFVNDYIAHIVESRGKVRGIGDMLGDSTGRAKFRIPFDTTQWKDISVTINGKETIIGLDTIFKRDIEDLMMGYSNSMEGHIALAKKNYYSYTNAMAIGEAEVGSARRNIRIAIDNIIGRPSFDIKNDGFSQFMKASANVAVGSFMYLSSVMQIKEAGSTAIRAAKNYDHFKQTVKEFKNVLKGRGSDDAVVNFIMDMTSQGNHMMTHKLHSRLYDDVANLHEGDVDGVFSKYLRASQRFRDAAMIAYGIAPITDIGQRMNGILNLDLLAKVAHGKVKLTKTEKEAYGITDDIINIAKKRLKITTQGNLHADSVMSIEKNSDEYDKISNVLFNMGQTQMLQPTLGTTPAMFIDSAMGSVMGTLLSYAMNAHAIYGTNIVKGLSRGEPMSYADTMLWFGTMMAAQMIKDEIRGVERDEEELIMASLVNMPMSAPFALAGLVSGDAVAFGINEQMQTSAASGVSSIADMLDVEIE